MGDMDDMDDGDDFFLDFWQQDEPSDMEQLQKMERELRNHLQWLGYYSRTIAILGCLLAMFCCGFLLYGNYCADFYLEPLWHLTQKCVLKLMFSAMLLVPLGTSVIRKGLRENAAEEDIEAALRWTIVSIVSTYLICAVTVYYFDVFNVGHNNLVDEIGQFVILSKEQESKLVICAVVMLLDLFFVVTLTFPYGIILSRILKDWAEFYDKLNVPLPSSFQAYRFAIKYGQPVTNSRPRFYKFTIDWLATIFYTGMAVVLSISLAIRFSPAVYAWIVPIFQTLLLKITYQLSMVLPRFRQFVTPEGLTILGEDDAVSLNITIATFGDIPPTFEDTLPASQPSYFPSHENADKQVWLSYIFHGLCFIVLVETIAAAKSGIDNWTSGSQVAAQFTFGLVSTARMAFIVRNCAAVGFLVLEPSGSSIQRVPSFIIDNSVFIATEIFLVLACLGALATRKNLLTGKGTYNKLMRRFQLENPENHLLAVQQ